MGLFASATTVTPALSSGVHRSTSLTLNTGAELGCKSPRLTRSLGTLTTTRAMWWIRTSLFLECRVPSRNADGAEAYMMGRTGLHQACARKSPQIKPLTVPTHATATTQDAARSSEQLSP